MVPYLGDFAEDATVYMPFNTFTSDDPSASSTITNLANGDIKVHKDGSTTQIVTDGATVAIDFDSITGNHLITVDTSAHSDYATGSDYLVRIEGTTVDGATVNAFIGSFSIENRFNAAAVDLANGTDGLGAIKAETAAILADTNELQSDDVPGLISTLDAVVDTVKVDTAAILTDTNELQGDWVNGGRLDLIQDAILADTNELQGDDVPGLISTLDAVVDTVKAETALIVEDTGTTIPATITTIDNEIATIDGIVDAILADTNELQGDWANGGRLDLLLDAIPTTAMRGTDSAATATNLATVDTVVDAIKAVTDQMVFTKANELDANTQSINGAGVVGDGNSTPWDGA